MPGIAAWEGLITLGRVGNGTFDLTDFSLPRSSSPTRSTGCPPTTTSTASTRARFCSPTAARPAAKTTISWSAYDFSAMRLAEYKIYFSRPAATWGTRSFIQCSSAQVPGFVLSD
ncbi:MAG: hypothetical protein U1E59_11775 [Amaricoccus sp.]